MHVLFIYASNSMMFDTGCKKFLDAGCYIASLPRQARVQLCKSMNDGVVNRVIRSARWRLSAGVTN